MGLFKKVGTLVGAQFGGAAGALAGKFVGGILDGKEATPQMQATLIGEPKSLTEVRKDVAKARAERDRDITDVTASTKLGLERLERDKQVALAEGRADVAGQIQQQQQSMLLQGAGQGGLERVSEKGLREGLRQSQRTRGLFAREASGARQSDLALQEEFKRNLVTQLPQLAAIPTRFELARNQANANLINLQRAGNMRARQLATAQKNAQWGQIGSMAGMAAGFALGGPTGASIGSSAGGLFAGGMGSSSATPA